MGKHGKPVPCSGCGGNGKTETWQDGKKSSITCPMCNGTGQA